MKPSSVAKSIRHLTSQRRAVMIWGSPGCGKSEVVKSVTAEDNLTLIDFRLAMRDPTDIKGFPMPDAKTKTMKFYRDGELPTEGKGILFMDEINSATPATQACAMQLTLTGRIGDYVLPEGWSIVAAGNRESDRSVVNRMPSALSDRFVHIDFEVDVDDWAAWAFKSGISSNTISFIRFRRDLLNAFDAKARSFPTPRSWVMVDRNIINSNLDSDTEFELVKGKVGEAAAGEYIAFIKTIRDMPNLDKILLDPDNQPVPEKKLSILHALATGLSMRTEKNNFDRVMQYMIRLPIEFQVMYVKDSVRRDDAICETRTFQKWVIDHSDVMV